MSTRKSGPLDYNVLPEVLRPLAERSEIRRFRKGALVIDEGDRGDALLIILAGELRAFTGSDTGRHVTYALYGPGDYLGEMGLAMRVPPSRPRSPRSSPGPYSA